MNLTDSAIRGLKPAEKRYTKADGGGLSIEVLPSGKKVFKLAYRFNGRQRNRALGPYPTLKLAHARVLRDEIKLKLINGIDPDISETADDSPPEQEEEITSWRAICESLLEKLRLEGKNRKTVGAVRNKLEKTYPYFGGQDARTVTPAQLLEVCQAVQHKGNYETAHRVRSAAGRVCRYAIAQGLMDRDISVSLKGALIQPRSEGVPALIEESEVAQLLKDVWSYNGNFLTVCALKLTAMTWLRSSELRNGTWDEVDWERQIWTIPAQRMKGPPEFRRKHLVPLSVQALEVLRQMQSFSGHRSDLMFPSIGGKTGRSMSEMTMNNALNALGYKGRHVPHGFRRTASTNLNEQGWDERWIEKQLSHQDRNRVRRAYNAAEYLEDRAHMMQHYSDWLDRLRRSS